MPDEVAEDVPGRSDHQLLSILRSGWTGRCPRCAEGKMFAGWLEVVPRCAACGLDYRFAAPDDGPAFFSLCIVALPLTFLMVWFQVAYDPVWWVHLLTTVPVMVGGCLLPLRPIKGWLVASQYLNRAQEAGTAQLWAKLHGLDEAGSSGPFDDPPADSRKPSLTRS